MSMLPKVLLWLFVVNLGVVFGAGIYEARISVPRWVSVSEAWLAALQTFALLHAHR